MLSALTNRKIGWALPPDGAKDLRAWLNAQADREELSERFFAGLKPTFTFIEPPAPGAVPEIDFVPDDRPQIALADYRTEMSRGRAQLEQGNVYLDRSETGCGKTHADVEVAVEHAQADQRTIIVLPTHNNGRETLEEFKAHPVDAARYPKRTTTEAVQLAKAERDDFDAVNCWNPLADRAEALGLPVLKTACIGCSFKEQCDAGGYRRQIVDATEATIAIATHARIGNQGLTELTKNRSLVLIEENPLPALRPSVTLELDQLEQAARLLHRLLSDPIELNQFCDDDEARDEDKTKIYEWLLKAANALDRLPEAIQTTLRLASVRPVGPLPKGVERHLWFAMRRLKKFSGGWRGIVAALSGEARTMIVVHPAWTSGPRSRRRETRSVVVTWSRAIPPHVSLLVSDATSSSEELASMVNRPVQEITPRGCVARQHRATQITERDISRQTSPNIVNSVLRGLLAEQPNLRRHGVICHRPHVAAVERLAAETQQISRVAYFGSGDERSSNLWAVGPDRCDRLIVLGTPRPGSEAIRSELVRRGRWEAAASSEPDWEPFRWRGKDEFGNPAKRLVQTRGYRNPEWQAVFVDLCRSSLIQAVGRGRGILAGGIPVVVVSSEPIGLPLRDGDKPWMNAQQAAALAAVRFLSAPRVSATNSNKYLIGKVAETRPAKTGDIVRHLREQYPDDPKVADCAYRTVHFWLTQVENLGAITRLGNRGWVPAIPVEDHLPAETDELVAQCAAETSLDPH